MLNHSVASSEFFSSLALNMRCATYPPPPGSAPGYQVAHQLREMYTKKVIIGIQADWRSGTKLRIDPCEPRTRSSASSFIFIAPMPPTAWTATTARTVTIVILITNWKRSVTRTPQRPDMVEITEV